MVGWWSGRGTGGAPFGRAMKYHAYLSSDGWKQKRAEARKRARNRCRVCGTSTGLHTHHKTYKNLGRERQSDLVMLCAFHHWGCHQFIDNWRARGWKKLSSYSLTMKYIARERKKLKKATR